MSDTGLLQQFNINELAGATAIMLTGISGILVIIFKSRCYCRLNLCYLCYCERKPPPDPEVQDSSDEEKLVPLKKDKKKGKVDKIDRGSKEIEKPEILKEIKKKEIEPEPEPEPELIPIP